MGREARTPSPAGPAVAGPARQWFGLAAVRGRPLLSPSNPPGSVDRFAAAERDESPLVYADTNVLIASLQAEPGHDIPDGLFGAAARGEVRLIASWLLRAELSKPPAGTVDESVVEMVEEILDNEQIMWVELDRFVALQSLGLARRLGLSEARRQLSRMVDRGLVEPRGEGGGRTYHLAAAVYRALRESAAYVRVRGFEPLQQEQMVLTYVDAHGRITRGEAADLCALSPSQATRLLQRLAGKGELVLVGEKRGAYYQRLSHN